MFNSKSSFLVLLLSDDVGLRHPVFALPTANWEHRDIAIKQLCHELLFEGETGPFLERIFVGSQGLERQARHALLSYAYVASMIYDREKRWAIISRNLLNIPTWVIGKDGLYECQQQLLDLGFKESSTAWIYELSAYTWDEQDRQSIVSGRVIEDSLTGVCSALFRKLRA